MTIYSIQLKNAPNQEFTTNINNNDYTITLRYNQIMTMSIQINGQYVCRNERVFANQFVAPYKWQREQLKGNFIFNTDNDKYPNYKDFNTSCNLYFITIDEINNG